MNTTLLKNTLDFIEEIVGHEWMENWVHAMRDNFGRIPQNVPPLALSWLKAKDELAAYQLTDRLIISESTVRLLQLGKDIQLLNEHLDLRYQLSLLRGNVEQFHTVCYLIHIATSYYRKNFAFKLSQDFPCSLTLLDDDKEIPILAIVPPVKNTSSLCYEDLSSAIETAAVKLPSSGGIIYINLSLTPTFSIEKLINEVNTKQNFNPLKQSISLIVTVPYVESQQFKHVMFPLKINKLGHNNYIL